jgi:hypothetical protein
LSAFDSETRAFRSAAEKNERYSRIVRFSVRTLFNPTMTGFYHARRKDASPRVSGFGVRENDGARRMDTPAACPYDGHAAFPHPENRNLS